MLKRFFLAGLLLSLMVCAGSAFGQEAGETDSMLVTYFVIKGGNLEDERAGITGTDGIKDNTTKTFLVGISGKGVYMQSTVLRPKKFDFREYHIVAIYEMMEIIDETYDAIFRARIYITKMNKDDSVANCRIRDFEQKIEFGEDFLVPVGSVGDYPELSLGFKIFNSSEWGE